MLPTIFSAKLLNRPPFTKCLQKSMGLCLTGANEKYAGDVVLGKTQVRDGVQVKTTDPAIKTTLKDHHPAIISKELFDMVQKEKKRRHYLRER